MESGQLYELLPDAQGREIRIELVFEHAPNEEAATFLAAAKSQLEAAGVELLPVALPDGY